MKLKFHQNNLPIPVSFVLYKSKTKLNSSIGFDNEKGIWFHGRRGIHAVTFGKHQKKPELAGYFGEISASYIDELMDNNIEKFKKTGRPDLIPIIFNIIW